MQHPHKESYVVQEWYVARYPSRARALAGVFDMLEGRHTIHWDASTDTVHITVEGVLCALLQLSQCGYWVVEVHAPSMVDVLRAAGFRVEEE